MPTLLARARFWPGIAAVILITIVLLPPAAGYARQYASAQALQFVIFAVAGPALLVLGAPWRTRSPDRPSGRGGRSRRPGARAIVVLTAFIALAIIWRLPATVNALARNPALAAAEMITLLAAGTGIWLELTSAPQGPGRLPRPARAAMAAAAMWTIWVLAYLTGIFGASWFAAYHQARQDRRPERGRGPADRHGYLVGGPGAVFPARPVRHGHCLAGRQYRLRRERAPSRIR